MKVALVSTYDHEGGAARAAQRLRSGLETLGTGVQLLVQERRGDEPGTSAGTSQLARSLAGHRPAIDALPTRLYPARRAGLFSPAWLPSDLPRRIRATSPDLVHLHWVANGCLAIEELPRVHRPLLWTLHDSWPFTGGCHVPESCERYGERCGACPILASTHERDLSRLTFLRKRRAWRDLPLTLVAPSQWLAKCAQKSALFRDRRVEVIPNGLDLSCFRPVDRSQARHLLRLPVGKRLIAFGALHFTADPNKGLSLLEQALAHPLIPKDSSVELLTFGAGNPNRGSDLLLPSHSLGRLYDDLSLALAYAAADVFVAPSRLENLPYSVMEAMASGTPAVAFDTGGVGELIDHEMDGFLARALDPVDLARGIAWVLEDDGRRRALGRAARQKCEQRFGHVAIAERYQALYREVLR